jgi:type IV pilus assembly protein PilE
MLQLHPKPLAPALAGSFSRSRGQRGFTVLELLIAVVILGVLVALAFPSYKDQIRKSRRSDAIAGIAAVQQAQERHRANSSKYGDLAVPAGANTLANVQATTANGHYLMTMVSNNEVGYEVHATAQGAQADDTNCKVIGAQLRGGALRYGSGAAGVDWTATDPDAGRCWAK